MPFLIVFHKTSFTRKHVFAMVGIAWLFGPLFNLARMIPTTRITSDGYCIFNLVWPNRFWAGFTSVITASLYFFIPFSLILLLYISIMIQLRRIATKGPLGENNQGQMKVMDKAKDNVLKTILFLSTCFFLCYVWNITFFLLLSLGVPLSTTTPLYNFSVFMININCCINPFCYAVQYREFQEQTKYLFCRPKTRRGNAVSSKSMECNRQSTQS